MDTPKSNGSGTGAPLLESESTRRQWLQGVGAGTCAGLVVSLTAFESAVAAAPQGNPVARYKQSWTDAIQWSNVVVITAIKAFDNDSKLAIAQRMLVKRGGGVVYFPPGTYDFLDHIKLKDGVILRGADPKVITDARNERYALATKIRFPLYKPLFQGDGSPINHAFKGINLDNPTGGKHTGVVNLDINRGHIHLGEAEDHKCDGHRVVFGCVLRNAAVADPRVPSEKYGQPAWQRFTARHHAAIDVVGTNVLIANNRLPKSGDANFTQKGYILAPARGKDQVYDVTFDYDNRPGLYINHYCVGGAGGSGNDGTPESHPYGFRKGTVIVDNYVFNTGRMCIGFAGDGTICSNNITRIEKDVWRPTNTGHKATFGSSTNDNRAIEMRGWRWQLIGNDCVVHRNWCAEKNYLINDGEGLMHEDHCNSTLIDSVLKGNKINSYLSLYKCGAINGLLIEDNDVSTPGKIPDVYVNANRNSGKQPCSNVTVVNNRTYSNGIMVAGDPAKNNIITGNEHKGKQPGVIRNEANAKVSGNKNYA